MRDATFAELRAVCEAWARRQRTAHEGRAWIVAHLMLATGNLPRGTTVGQLWRELLGRDPAPGEETPAAERPALSPEESVAYMEAWLHGHGRGPRA